ncbi:hypothetical protein Tco_0371466 [Tanacetum coccineum]
MELNTRNPAHTCSLQYKINSGDATNIMRVAELFLSSPRMQDSWADTTLGHQKTADVPAVLPTTNSGGRVTLLEIMFRAYFQLLVETLEESICGTRPRTHTYCDVKLHETELVIQWIKAGSHKDNPEVVDDDDDIKERREEGYERCMVRRECIDEDEVIPEDVTHELIAESQNVDKRVPTIFDHARMNLMNTKTFVYNKDLFFLKYGNTEEKKYILSLHKIHAKEFPDLDLEENLRCVDEPQMGLIYLNSKDEKRVMYLEEIVKFCDATLEKVLDEVKLRMFESKFLKNANHSAEVEGEIRRHLCKAYEREISKRLSHRQQMRR